MKFKDRGPINLSEQLVASLINRTASLEEKLDRMTAKFDKLMEMVEFAPPTNDGVAGQEYTKILKQFETDVQNLQNL